MRSSSSLRWGFYQPLLCYGLGRKASSRHAQTFSLDQVPRRRSVERGSVTPVLTGIATESFANRRIIRSNIKNMTDTNNNTIVIDGDTVTITPPMPIPIVMTREEYLSQQNDLLSNIVSQLDQLNVRKDTFQSQIESTDSDIAALMQDKSDQEALIASLS